MLQRRYSPHQTTGPGEKRVGPNSLTSYELDVGAFIATKSPTPPEDLLDACHVGATIATTAEHVIHT
jgi:hypothetical protein